MSETSQKKMLTSFFTKVNGDLFINRVFEDEKGKFYLERTATDNGILPKILNKRAIDGVLSSLEQMYYVYLKNITKDDIEVLSTKTIQLNYYIDKVVEYCKKISPSEELQKLLLNYGLVEHLKIIKNKNRSSALEEAANVLIDGSKLKNYIDKNNISVLFEEESERE